MLLLKQVAKGASDMPRYETQQDPCAPPKKPLRLPPDSEPEVELKQVPPKKRR